jgi:hypothetical protein
MTKSTVPDLIMPSFRRKPESFGWQIPAFAGMTIDLEILGLHENVLCIAAKSDKAAP